MRKMAIKIKACYLWIKTCRYGLRDVAFSFFKGRHVVSDMRNMPGEKYCLRGNFLQDDLCLVRLKLAQWFFRKSRKYKSLPTDGLTTGDQKSSLELSADVR
jgi:hypothetical protein